MTVVDAAWLTANLGAVKLADVRSYGTSLLNAAAFNRGHIPGAVFFDMETDLCGVGQGRHPLPDAERFALLLGERGIGGDDTVVVYDDAGGGAAARLWWMIRSLGGIAVLLDGGIQAWASMGGEVTTAATAPEPASFSTDGWTGVITGEELTADLDGPTLLDARSAERFRGENETLDPEGGHIPGAVSKPYTDNLNPDGTFRSVGELRELYSEVEGDIVAYCGSGVTACHTIAALEVAGITGVRLYPGSWSGWITDPERPRA